LSLTVKEAVALQAFLNESLPTSVDSNE